MNDQDTIDPVLLLDLKRLCSLPISQLETIGQWKSYKAVKCAIDTHFETETAESLLRFFTFFADCNADEFIRDLAELRQKSDILQEKFSDQDLEGLRERFSIIQEPVHCIAKHERLKCIIGNQLRDINLVCDMRLVFDDSHEKIEDIVSLAILKISYATQTDELQVLEITLDEDDIEQLSDLIDSAKKKWNVIKKKWNKLEDNYLNAFSGE